MTTRKRNGNLFTNMVVGINILIMITLIAFLGDIFEAESFSSWALIVIVVLHISPIIVKMSKKEFLEF